MYANSCTYLAKSHPAVGEPQRSSREAKTSKESSRDSIIWTNLCHTLQVHSGQGKLEKSGNIDYSPIVREFENDWLENQNLAHYAIRHY